MEGTSKRLSNPHRRNLNDLPDEILVRILSLSFYRTIDAIDTSLISRRWRTLWSLLPSLNLNQLHPAFVDEDNPYNYGPSFLERPFVNFITFVLNNRMNRHPDSPFIQTFRLSMEYDMPSASEVDSWMHSAVTLLRARVLDLDFSLCFRNEDFHSIFKYDYHFPFSVLSNGSVQVLRLKGRFLPIKFPANMSVMNLCSLRSLYLNKIMFEDQDEEIRDLIMGCPNLEDLKLKSCGEINNLSICSTSLQRLVLLGEMSSFGRTLTCEIDCPNLCSIYFNSCIQFVGKNVPSLVEFCNCHDYLNMEDYYSWGTIVGILKQASPHIKKLTIHNFWFKPAAESFLQSRKLQNLIHLELYTEYTHNFLVGMASLLELCPNLETMVLDDIWISESIRCIPEEFPNKRVQFEIPRLKQVTMNGYCETVDTRNFVTMLKMQGVALEKIVLVPKYQFANGTIVISRVNGASL